MKLVIAEKSSVAQSLAKVIGANQKKDGYLEGNGYIVSWCVGHLIELANPEHYDEKYKKWRKEDLPIFPAPFSYQVTASTKKQYQVLKELMKRSDIDSLVEATDAGREGELIFRLVYKQAGCKKPFERLWISSMEDKAIKDGFANLKPSADYDDLYEAALCRERADWLVGINATRFFSTVYGQTLNVGRVMTPTLAMIVEREAEIKGFKPENFYNVQMLVSGVAVTSKRFKHKQEAEKLAQKVNATDKAKISKMETSTRQEKTPLLYDLTSLQRDANKYYGFTAQQTLDYTQSLYEKKLVTYPRTDSRYLTDDMDDSTARLCCLMKDKYGYTKMVPISTKQILNSSKVSDHHAIIPTENVSDADYSEIPSGEQKILVLVTAIVEKSHDAMLDEKRASLYEIVQSCMADIHKDANVNEETKLISDKADKFYSQQKDSIASEKSLRILDGVQVQLWGRRDEAVMAIDAAKAPKVPEKSSVTPAGGDVPPTPPKKEIIKKVARQQMFPAKVLKSDEEIDAYVENIRKQMKQYMQGSDGIQITN